MHSLLPPELWHYTLSFIEPEHLQPTALALSRAIPSASISSSLLWRNVHLSREGQAWQAISKLRHLKDEGIREAVKSVRATAFREDPQQLVNFLLSLPRPRYLSINVGPLAAPEQLEELVEPRSALRTSRFSHLSHLSFRFNPYCMERSYFVFLKGAYFDSLVHALSKWDPVKTAPKLKKLSFSQDLPPNHGASKKKETPAFGLHDLEEELGQIEGGGGGEQSFRQPPASGRFARKSTKEAGKLDFAQPIVFFRLDCLATLAVSPIGQTLTHLSLRLPRRNLLTALTASQTSPSFPSLTHLDLSTTHIVDDARFPTLLRLHPNLEHLVIDRCTGLISADAVDENTAIATMTWLGKCCGGIGFSRAEEALRSWRRIVKERPTDAPNLPRSARRPLRTSSRTSLPSTTHGSDSIGGGGIDSLIPPVKELFVLPPLPKLSSLSAGLHSRLSASTRKTWTRSFQQGYSLSLERSIERIEEYLDRWQLWKETGKLNDETRRMVTFRDTLRPEEFVEHQALIEELSNEEEGEEGAGGRGGVRDPDPTFDRFLREKNLVVVDPSIGHDLLLLYRRKLDDFTLCLTPDCSDSAGVPRLSLSLVGKETVEEREKREKEIDEAEEKDRFDWRRDEREHERGCGHLELRRAWTLE